MALSDVIARLAVSLTLETAAFEEGATLAEKRLQQSERRFQAFGRRMQGIGRTMSLALSAPLIALGVASVKAAIESRDALGQVEAALHSMGNAAGRTSEQLQDLATGLMRQSLFDDDEILRKVTANLLTFGTISGQQFDRAQEAALNLATRLHMDLQPATLLVGKALNDPIKGLTALRRVGIQFTEQQRDQIKAMAAAGDAAGAQRAILAELERQFGGSAAAAREANPLGALRLSFEEFKETVGEKLLPLLPRITDAIIGLLDAFSKLSPTMQTIVVAGAGIAAVFGPLLVTLGSLIQILAPLLGFFSEMVVIMAGAETASAAMAAGLAGFGTVLGGVAAAAAPFVAAAAAIAATGYLIYENWDKIQPVLEDLWKTIQATIGPPFMRLVDALSDALSELWSGPLGEGIRAVSPYILEFARIVASALGDEVVTTIKAMAFAIGLAFDTVALAVRTITALFDGTFARIIIDAVRRVYEGVKTWIQDRLGAIFDGVAEKVQAAAGWFKWLQDVTVGHSYIPDMVNAIAREMDRLDAVMVQPVTRATSKAEKAFRDMAGEVQSILDRLFPEEAALRTFNRERAKIIEGVKDPDARNAALIALSQERSDAQSNERQSALREALQSFPDSLDDGTRKVGDALRTMEDKAHISTVKIAESFKDMADNAISALDRLANAIKGGGTFDIINAVLNLGLQLTSMGLFGSKAAAAVNKVPGRATGGSITGGRPYLVGERGVEMVVPGRSGTVVPNKNLGGNTYHIQGNLLTPEFWAMIQAGDFAAARAGAQGGVARLQQINSRRLG